MLTIIPSLEGPNDKSNYRFGAGEPTLSGVLEKTKNSPGLISISFFHHNYDVAFLNLFRDLTTCLTD